MSATAPKATAVLRRQPRGSGYQPPEGLHTSFVSKPPCPWSPPMPKTERRSGRNLALFESAEWGSCEACCTHTTRVSRSVKKLSLLSRTSAPAVGPRRIRDERPRWQRDAQRRCRSCAFAASLPRAARRGAVPGLPAPPQVWRRGRLAPCDRSAAGLRRRPHGRPPPPLPPSRSYTRFSPCCRCTCRLGWRCALAARSLRHKGTLPTLPATVLAPTRHPPLPLAQRLTLLQVHPRRYELLELVLDLGRVPRARFPDGEEALCEEELTREALDEALRGCGTFGADNRAGIDRTLHRVRAAPRSTPGALHATRTRTATRHTRASRTHASTKHFKTLNAPPVRYAHPPPPPPRR